MNCKIIVTDDFLRNLKHLAKKYKSIKTDVAKLGEDLRSNPTQGADLGNGIRKVRMAITSKGKGKSGGTRVITYNVLVAADDTDIMLLSIYDKSEKSTITDAEIQELRRKNGIGHNV